MSSGFVRIWHDDEGWGVIDGPDVPGGCWTHFSAIAQDGYRSLDAGQHVSFRSEAAAQDGYAHRATKVWTSDAEPPDDDPSPSPAYRSVLTLHFDDEPVEP
jgi:CspA family cold shock protein